MNIPQRAATKIVLKPRPAPIANAAPIPAPTYPPVLKNPIFFGTSTPPSL
jgi:hypothetical protein